MKMNLTLMLLDESDREQFKTDMSDAFQFYTEDGYFPAEERILPVEEIEQTLCKANSIAYKAVQDNRIVGGAIVSIDKQRQRGSLELLYVKSSTQSQGIGKFMWFEIERFHPDVTIWETITPAFAKRNIHFYINVCGFQITEYFNPHHPNPHPQPNYDGPDDDFRFEKRMIMW
ncbi:GNAT family N-acetyltransferase [uncultured Bacteroides sp.]|uniref:GNAT family N-acetyltransferase n=1 Tax=uncultured Bacteroides sp. TaxID=162156 RepID=UPI00280A959E|nr:GNAT family N-acetyltransferase [uncultured Bacteroides sp.]